MARKKYTPPEQGKTGQILDAGFLLLLVYASLLVPLTLGLTASQTTTQAPAEVTWETLGQNETMQAQWTKLGVSLEDATPMITEKFDYTINPVALLVTAVVIVGYFLFVFRMSKREYLDVIAEKFDEG
jgi:hypothetical protein